MGFPLDRMGAIQATNNPTHDALLVIGRNKSSHNWHLYMSYVRLQVSGFLSYGGLSILVYEALSLWHEAFSYYAEAFSYYAEPFKP
jgi:hypothetical protein